MVGMTAVWSCLSRNCLRNSKCMSIRVSSWGENFYSFSFSFFVAANSFFFLLLLQIVSFSVVVSATNLWEQSLENLRPHVEVLGHSLAEHPLDHLRRC